MIRKIASLILFVVLVLSAFFIFTSSPKNFARDLPGRKSESVKMNESSSGPVSYLVVGNYEPNYQPFDPGVRTVTEDR
jgi:hypothetical protein